MTTVEEENEDDYCDHICSECDPEWYEYLCDKYYGGTKSILTPEEVDDGST